MKNKIITIPNLLSLFRLLLIPLLIWLYLFRGDNSWAIAVLALSALTVVFGFVLALLLGLRRPLLLIVCTVLLLAIVYGVFVRFLSVPVPLGVFEEFTFSDIAGSLAKAKAAWALL